MFSNLAGGLIMVTATSRPRPRTGRRVGAADWARARRAAVLIKQASDATRLRILTHLADGECHVGALCDELRQTQPAVSHHLALLRHGGLIVPRRQGKNNFYALTPAGTELARVVAAMV
jgi:DNA-binding transcriptional ArsR family regulator